MAKNEAKINSEEIKKWAGDIVHSAKTTIAETIDNIKESTDELSKKQSAAKRQKDLLLLRPIFKDTFDAASNLTSLRGSRQFQMPAMISIVEKDKKHKESPACEHALGHISTENGIEVLNLYPHHMKDLEVTFYPNMEKKIYYVDPFQKNLYIDIEQYFQQQRTARVDELERLAYELGAKHAEIKFKTDNVALENAKRKAGIGVKKKKKKLVDAKAEHEEKTVSKESIEVEKVIDTTGHNNPQVPDLIYFKDDEDIKNLIYMRIDTKSKLKSKECKIKYSNSLGIKSSDAAKIQGALDIIGGGSADISIMNETLNENCTTLIYKIEF